jgi:hypothetical protein
LHADRHEQVVCHPQLGAPINDRLWHLPFNRLEKINEQLVEGRESIFFGWEFDAAATKLPADVIDYYVGLLSDPDSLRASFGFYRALDATIVQDGRRKTQRLQMPPSAHPAGVAAHAA